MNQIPGFEPRRVDWRLKPSSIPSQPHCMKFDDSRVQICYINIWEAYRTQRIGAIYITCDDGSIVEVSLK